MVWLLDGEKFFEDMFIRFARNVANEQTRLQSYKQT